MVPHRNLEGTVHPKATNRLLTDIERRADAPTGHIPGDLVAVWSPWTACQSPQARSPKLEAHLAAAWAQQGEACGLAGG